MTTTRTAPTSTWSGRAMLALRITFALLPIATGVDKFFEWMTGWSALLAPWIVDLLPVTAETFMLGAGVVEIAAGLLVSVRPDVGGFVIAAWLGGIVVNLVTFSPPTFFATALRDLGLAAGAFALGALSLGWRRSGTGSW